MRKWGPIKSRRTWGRGVANIQRSKPESWDATYTRGGGMPGGSRTLLYRWTWRFKPLLHIVVLAAFMCAVNGFAFPCANAQNDRSSETIQYRQPTPVENETDPVGQGEQEPTSWAVILAYLFLPAVLIAFLLGQRSVRQAPPQADVLTAVNTVFLDQIRLGAVYNFQHLGPVLSDAQRAVLAALKKLKLID